MCVEAFGGDVKAAVKPRDCPSIELKILEDGSVVQWLKRFAMDVVFEIDKPFPPIVEGEPEAVVAIVGSVSYPEEVHGAISLKD